MKKALALVLALCAPWPVAAQNAITQEGTVLQNSPMMFRGNNRARQGSGVKGAPTGQIVTTGDAVVGGRCDYSAPIDDPAGYYKLCIDAKSGKITLDGTRLPKQGTLTVEISGQPYVFPSSVTIVGSDAAVSNNPALKNITGAVGKRLVRLGFNTPGDGGLATYNWSETNCVLADNGAQVQPTGVTGCWIADFSGMAPTAMIWGCLGDGTGDDRPCVQAAIDAMSTAKGILHFDAKHLYRIVGTLNVTKPLKMSGQYRYGTWVTRADDYRGCAWGLIKSDNLTLLNVTANTVTIDGVCMQLFPDGNNSATAGAAIRLSPPSIDTSQTGVTLTNNYILNPWEGIILDGYGPQNTHCCGVGGSGDNYIAHNTIANPRNIGISIGRNTANSMTVGNSIINNAIVCIGDDSKANAIGVALYDGAIWYNGTEVGPEMCRYGMTVLPGTVGGLAQQAQFQITGVMGDQSGWIDMLIRPNTSLGVVAFSEIIGGWASAGKGGQLHIDNSMGGRIMGINVIGGFFHSSAAQVEPIIRLQGDPDSVGEFGAITIMGAQIDCWQGGTCMGPGIDINSVGTGQPSRVIISSNHIGNNNAAGTALLDTAIRIRDAGGPGFINIVGNDLSEALTPIDFYSNDSLSRVQIETNQGVNDHCDTTVNTTSTIRIPASVNCIHINGSGTITNIENIWNTRKVMAFVDSDAVNFTIGGPGPSPGVCNGKAGILRASVVMLVFNQKSFCWAVVGAND